MVVSVQFLVFVRVQPLAAARQACRRMLACAELALADQRNRTVLSGTAAQSISTPSDIRFLDILGSGGPGTQLVVVDGHETDGVSRARLSLSNKHLKLLYSCKKTPSWADV